MGRVKNIGQLLHTPSYPPLVLPSPGSPQPEGGHCGKCLLVQGLNQQLGLDGQHEVATTDRASDLGEKGMTEGGGGEEPLAFQRVEERTE